MASFNKVFIMGNLAGNVESKEIKSGMVAKFSVAVSRKYQSNGETKEETDFFYVKVFGKTAENCAKYLAKGSSVFVCGRLKTEKWETQSGEKRSSVVVMGDEIQFLSSSKNRDEQRQSYAPQKASPRQVDKAYAPPPMPESNVPPVQDDIPF